MGLEKYLKNNCFVLVFCLYLVFGSTCVDATFKQKHSSLAFKKSICQQAEASQNDLRPPYKRFWQGTSISAVTQTCLGISIDFPKLSRQKMKMELASRHQCVHLDEIFSSVCSLICCMQPSPFVGKLIFVCSHRTSNPAVDGHTPCLRPQPC